MSKGLFFCTGGRPSISGFNSWSFIKVHGTSSYRELPLQIQFFLIFLIDHRPVELHWVIFHPVILQDWGHWDIRFKIWTDLWDHQKETLWCFGSKKNRFWHRFWWFSQTNERSRGKRIFFNHLNQISHALNWSSFVWHLSLSVWRKFLTFSTYLEIGNQFCKNYEWWEFWCCILRSRYCEFDSLCEPSAAEY